MDIEKPLVKDTTRKFLESEEFQKVLKDSGLQDPKWSEDIVNYVGSDESVRAINEDVAHEARLAREAKGELNRVNENSLAVFRSRHNDK